MNDALEDEYWIHSTKEELSQFIGNEVWSLVSKLDGAMVIDTKCVFSNQEDEDGKVVKKNPDWLHKDIYKKKALILRNHLLQ